MLFKIYKKTFSYIKNFSHGMHIFDNWDYNVSKFKKG